MKKVDKVDVPYSQIGLIRIQGNSFTGQPKRRAVWGIHYLENKQTSFRMLGYSLFAALLKIALRGITGYWFLSWEK